MPETVYRILRQQVVARLPPGGDPAAVLQVIAHAAICGSAQAAQLDLVTAGAIRDLTVVDEVLAWVETQWASVVAELHDVLQARMRAALRPGVAWDAVFTTVREELVHDFIQGEGS
jgi:hypothetical protein